MIASTARTEIDRIRRDDAAFFVELLNSPGWLRFIGDRDVHTAADAVAWLEGGFLACYDKHGWGYWIVRLKDGTPIGICGFLKKAYLENEDFGFAFLPEYCGQGYGHEAAAAVLEYGLREYGFEVLDAVTVASNAASIALLGKLGFRAHGTVDIPDCEGDHRLYRWARESA